MRLNPSTSGITSRSRTPVPVQNTVESETLVIGATGFLGGAVTDALRASGSRVSVMMRRQGSEGVYRDRSYRGDLCDEGSVRAVLERVKPTRVFHAASLTPSNANNNLSALFETNVMGTLHLLETLAAECPFSITVLLSSGAVYGGSSRTALCEPDPFQPATAYAASKVAQEMTAVSYGAERSLKIVRARPFNLVGPGEPDGLVCSSFCRQVAAAELGVSKPVVTVGRLDTVRDFTDVRDAARACLLLSEHGHPGEAYNVCSGRPVTIARILEHVVSLSRVPIRVIARSAAPPPTTDVSYQSGSYDKLHRATGWTPTVSLEDSLADLLNWWRDRLQEGHSS